MAVQKKRVSAKKKVVRHTAETAAEKAAESKKKEPLIPPSPISSRPKESNEGFGVLKGVAAVIAILIIGSAILFNRAGGREAARGDKELGESCASTQECAKGSICFEYDADGHRCVERCSKSNPCDTGYTCVSAASSKRKGIRVTEICIQNDKVQDNIAQ